MSGNLLRTVSHGGYLFRQAEVSGAFVQALARDALITAQESVETSLVSLKLVGTTLVAVSFESKAFEHHFDAVWFSLHHAFAIRLSQHLTSPVHVYALDSDNFELVRTYASGKAVGGERVTYDHIDAPDDDAAFEAMQDEWPLSRLARILGIRRRNIEKLHRLLPTHLALHTPPAFESLWHLLAPSPTIAAGRSPKRISVSR
jgi:hypothetical protein